MTNKNLRSSKRQREYLQVVTKRSKSSVQFIGTDVSRSIRVKRIETRTPLLNVVPKRRKFLKVYGPISKIKFFFP